MQPKPVTIASLRELFSYDGNTGFLTWKVSPANNVQVGDLAGTIASVGRRQVRIFGRKYYASVIAWAWMTGDWPALEVDHINGDSLDDRWSNLRLATRSQNQANTRRNTRNTSGYRGVSFHKETGRWQAYITIDYRRQYLGYRSSAEEAAALYNEAAARLFGSFARPA